MPSQIPALYKLALGVAALLVALYVARWLSGVDVYVRGPFFWALLVVKSIAIVLTLAAALQGIRRSRRGKYPEPILGEPADGPRRRQLQGAASMGFVAVPILSSIVYMFAATDDGDPHSTGPLDLAAYASTGVLFVLLIAMLIWMSLTSMRR